MRIDPSSTALVLIDLQIFTRAAQLVPHDGEALQVRCARLADACRAAGVRVVLVKVSAGDDGAMTLTPPNDAAMPFYRVPEPQLQLQAEIGPRPGDLVVTKYNWGAFYGTDLDIQLRRRGVDTIIIGGIATNFGVESTVRQGHERGYSQIVVEDACAAFTQIQHDYPMREVFPRIARVRTTDEVLSALSSGPEKAA